MLVVSFFPASHKDRSYKYFILFIFQSELRASIRFLSAQKLLGSTELDIAASKYPR